MLFRVQAFWLVIGLMGLLIWMGGALGKFISWMVVSCFYDAVEYWYKQGQKKKSRSHATEPTRWKNIDKHIVTASHKSVKM